MHQIWYRLGLRSRLRWRELTGPPSWILRGPTSKESRGRGRRENRGKGERGKQSEKGEGERGKGRRGKEDQALNWNFWLRQCFQCVAQFHCLGLLLNEFGLWRGTLAERSYSSDSDSATERERDNTESGLNSLLRPATDGLSAPVQSSDCCWLAGWSRGRSRLLTTAWFSLEGDIQRYLVQQSVVPTRHLVLTHCLVYSG